MATFLIVTRRHGLMPIANRLRREGHEVKLCLYNKRGRADKYESAYGSVFEFVGHMGDSDWDDKLASLQDLARDGECIVVTDSAMASEAFKDAALIYRHEDEPHGRTSVRVGAWSSQSGMVGHHLCIADSGAWTGCMGPAVDAAMTLVRGSPEIVADWGESGDYVGPCSQDLAIDESGVVPVGPVVRGWHPLHQHAMLSQLPNVGDVLSGDAEFVLPARFTVAAALSQPPWPNPGQGKRLQSAIEGFTPAMSSHVMWHDVTADVEKKELRTLGLDGLVGVVHAGAHSFELAQSTVQQACAALRFPCKQYRADIGAQVREVLAYLEYQHGILL